MAVSKSMDFPGAKKSGYAAQVEQSQTSTYPDNSLSFLPVPGPVGPQGPAGRDGKDGKEGPQGPEGKQGPKGEKGSNGKDGTTLLSKSMQQPGWSKYFNNSDDSIRTGATKGEEGWVSFFLSPGSKENIETYIPKNAINLYNFESRRLHFRNLELGSIINVVYNFEITTYSSNTEVWVRSYFPSTQTEYVSFAASLKYQYTYDLSVSQVFSISTTAERDSGVIPQIRTDMDGMAKLKSIHILDS